MNIVWITYEDSSPDLGCYGDRTVPTPNADRLAAAGCVFRQAFSTAPVSAPARAAAITGLYSPFLGTHHMRTTHANRDAPGLPTPYEAVLPHYVKCVSEYFRAAGYYCTNNHKTDYQFGVPFTAWDNSHPKDWRIRYDIRTYHWRQRAPGQPFFAVFNLAGSHESSMWAGNGEPATDPATVPVPPYFPDTPEVRKAIARHYDQIAHNDTLAGQVLDDLDADGLAADTAVILWSDHGPSVRGKRWLYDSGLRVPLIVRWPGGLEPGSARDDLVSTVDLAPTILSLAGLDIPRHLHGRAFLGPATQPPRDYIFAARDRMDESWFMARAARDRRFKYIANGYPGAGRLQWTPYLNRHPITQEIWAGERRGTLGAAPAYFFRPAPAEELYDTAADPHETCNLAGDPAHRSDLERLRAALADWSQRHDRFRDVDEAEMVRRWYPDGIQPTTATPAFIPVADGLPGIEARNEGGTFGGPLLLMLHCASQNASIGWTAEPGDDPHWNLYTQPLRLAEGTHALRAKAIRYGYRESAERRATFVIGAAAAG